MKLSFEKKTFITIFLILLGLELVNYYSFLSLPILFILLSLFFFALFSILKIKPHEKTLYPIFVLPLVLLTESFFVLNAIPIVSLRHLFIIAFGFLLYLVIFSLNALKSHIISYSVIIFNILTIAYLISTFFAFVVLYNFYLLFSFPAWVFMILIGFISFLFFLFHLWKNDLLKNNFRFYSLLLSVIMIEFFWILTFWPLLALYSGFVLFIIYYTFSGLVTFHLKKSLDRKALIEHVIVPLIILFFFLISMKW